MQNLYATFSAGFPKNHDRTLLSLPDGPSASYADAERESARLARLLSTLGCVPGDRVTVQAPKSPQVVWLYLACLRGGFIYHPLNDAYRAAELEYFLGDARPKLAICTSAREAEFRALTQDLDCRVLTLDADGGGSLAAAATGTPPECIDADCGADAVAVLLYSSGTTGQPKGALLTHGNLAANTATLIDAWGFTAQDSLLHMLPIYHAHGLFVGLGCALMSGAQIIFCPKFDAEEAVRRLPDATVMMGIPTFYTRLLATPGFDRECCASMRLFISGSAPLRADTHAAFRERSGHAILERYGMTETSMLSSNPLDGERRPGSVGPPLAGIDIRVVDARDLPVAAGAIGAIQVRGPNVFRGYWNLPEKTTEEFTADGFFRTGDQGRLSDDGYLTILGRDKDMIITGGLNVYPKEIEQAIDRLDGIVESAVVGVPHADFGEAIVAVVVPESGSPVTAAGIIEQLRGQLADFKLPKEALFVGELPRNAMGKVEKNELRQRYADILS